MSIFSDLGTVTNPYGAAPPKGVTYAQGKHTGLDVKLSNEMISPLAGGVVEDVGYNKSYGNYVWVKDSNNMHTLYAHMKTTPLVKKGQQVTTKSVLGLQGATGQATGPHLHVEVRKNKSDATSTVDPEKYFELADAVKFGKSPIERTVNMVSSGVDTMQDGVQELGSNIQEFFTGSGFLSVVLRVGLVILGVVLVVIALKSGFLGGK